MVGNKHALISALIATMVVVTVTSITAPAQSMAPGTGTYSRSNRQYALSPDRLPSATQAQNDKAIGIVGPQRVTGVQNQFAGTETLILPKSQRDKLSSRCSDHRKDWKCSRSRLHSRFQDHLKYLYPANNLVCQPTASGPYG